MPVKNTSKKVAANRDQKFWKKKSAEAVSLFDRVNFFFGRWDKLFLVSSMLLMAVFGVLFFDVKVSDGGDDSSYIVRAHEFLHHFKFPTWEGPLYPIVLSSVVAIFGIHLVALKSFSLLCLLIFLFVFYRSFRKRIPAVILFFSMLTTSSCYFVIYFGSQTYSEAFFMMIQSVLFLIFFNYFFENEKESISLGKDYGKFLLLGFWLAIVYLTKNIGLAAAIAVVFYFLLVKHWRSALLTLLCFGLFTFIFKFLKGAIWNIDESQIKGEGSGLLYKDFYNPSEGYEDAFGFLVRFIDNSHLYLSRHLYIFMGLKSDMEKVPALTIFTYGLFLFAFICVFRRNRFILFTGTYIGIMCGITFLVLQKTWDQWRLIIIYFPLILVFVSGGLYYLFEKKILRRFQFVLVILLVTVFFTTLKATYGGVKAAKEILKQNLRGDMLFGMHPGWANFIRMSQWAAENVPEGKIIASRKPDMSFVYTGREFYPIYSVPKVPKDTLLKQIENDTASVYVTVEERNIFKKKGLEKLYESSRYYMKAFISGESDPNSKQQGSAVNILYAFPKAQAEQLCAILSANKVPYEKGVKEILASLKAKYDFTFVYDPDMLLRKLKRDGVEYAIITNIKYKNSHGQLITSMGTVSNFLHFIELKYPILSPVHKIGGMDDSAQLLQIHYERLNTAVVKL